MVNTHDSRPWGVLFVASVPVRPNICVLLTVVMALCAVSAQGASQNQKTNSSDSKAKSSVSKSKENGKTVSKNSKTTEDEKSSDDQSKSSQPSKGGAGSDQKSASDLAATAEMKRNALDPEEYNWYVSAASDDDFDVEAFSLAELLPPEQPKVDPPIATKPTGTGVLSQIFGIGGGSGKDARGTWLWPEGGAVATTVNTDYRTRSSSTALPVFVCGKGFSGIGNLPIGKEDKYRGQLADYTPTDLVLIPLDHCYYRQPCWMRREAAEAYMKLREAAKKDGVNVAIFSGWRNRAHQSRLKSGGGRVGRVGYSEHHMGTTMDVTDTASNATSNSYGNSTSGRWMQRNAAKYGFKATVRSEPWHWRYFGKGKI